jgi:hypothetical protein
MNVNYLNVCTEAEEAAAAIELNECQTSSHA